MNSAKIAVIFTVCVTLFMLALGAGVGSYGNGDENDFQNIEKNLK